MKTLIDHLLEEQQQMTAVEKFSQRQTLGSSPSQARYYQDLIPLSRPGPRQQYAFEVNLDSCSGCKACVSACHSLNGLEENEAWRDVGLLVGSESGSIYQQIVTTACHHCEDPGCLNGCPVAAYEKNPDTGIVRHLDDQCIGCQYCVMKCPYDVPKYSQRLGIVRKCDMCQERLAVEEAPACVQACPHQAISITLVDRERLKEGIRRSPQEGLLPGAFTSAYTLPTTQYTTAKSGLSKSRPIDSDKLRLEQAHLPLVSMLVFTQAATGLAGAAAFLSLFSLPGTFFLPFALATAAFVLLNIGLFTATLHLGRPLGAWRFFLGLRTSWMSRELLAFTLFAGTLAVTLPCSWFWPFSNLARANTSLSFTLGLLAVFTSVMIYSDTHRTLWNARETAIRFFGTVLLFFLLGIAFSLSFLVTPAQSGWICGLVLLTGLSLLGLTAFGETARWRALSRREHPWHRSARLQFELQPKLTRTIPALSGVVLALLGLAAFLLLSSNPVNHHLPPGVPLALGGALALTGLASLLDRYQFFTSVVAYRMPGQL